MIRILHTADWHIDAPLRSFTDQQRRELRASLMELPGKIADLCLKEGCDLVLLAGDVFDGPYTREGYEAVYRALERMEVPVFIAPGNHDPYRDASPWVREPWPDNVYLFRRQEISSFAIRELDCRVYGAAHTGPECPGLLENFQAQCAERYALLVLHADPTDPHSPYCPVTAAQVRDSGLDYAALGHIHAMGQFEAGAGVCVWPGCPMGKGFDETGTKGVCIAELGDSISFRFLSVEGPRFYDHTVAALSDPAEAIAAVLPPMGSRDHIRVRLTGETAAGATDGLALRFADWPNLTILDDTIVPGDVWDSAGDDTLTGLFFRILRDEALTADPETAKNLELAARIGRKILEGREVELP